MKGKSEEWDKWKKKVSKELYYRMFVLVLGERGVMHGVARRSSGVAGVVFGIWKCNQYTLNRILFLPYIVVLCVCDECDFSPFLNFFSASYAHDFHTRLSTTQLWNLGYDSIFPFFRWRTGKKASRGMLNGLSSLAKSPMSLDLNRWTTMIRISAIHFHVLTSDKLTTS